MRRIRGTLIVATAIIIPAFVIVFIITGSNDPELIQNNESIPEPVELTTRQLVFNTYSNYIRHHFDSLHTVGAALTIVSEGEVAMTETLGNRKADLDDPVDEHTIFRMASVSKGFAGVLAAILDKKRNFSLDDRVIDHYPDFKLKDSANTYGMTIRHLLSHTTGLVPHAFDNLVESGTDLKEIVARLVEVDISAPPGELYGYQNVTFSMIDPIVESVSGITYADLLQKEIFDRLYMYDASAGKIDTSAIKNIAFPHLKGKNGYFPVRLHEGYYNVLPAAGVNASISDMGKWLQALLGDGRKPFSNDILNQISTPVIYTPLKWQYTRQWERFKERYYSLGWRIYDYKGRRIVYHGGYVRGYRAEIAFCPEEQIGIAYLQNSPNGLASKAVPVFFDMVFGAIDEVVDTPQ